MLTPWILVQYQKPFHVFLHFFSFTPLLVLIWNVFFLSRGHIWDFQEILSYGCCIIGINWLVNFSHKNKFLPISIEITSATSFIDITSIIFVHFLNFFTTIPGNNANTYIVIISRISSTLISLMEILFFYSSKKKQGIVGGCSIFTSSYLEYIWNNFH